MRQSHIQTKEAQWDSISPSTNCSNSYTLRETEGPGEEITAKELNVCHAEAEKSHVDKYFASCSKSSSGGKALGNDQTQSLTIEKPWKTQI